MTLQNIGAKLVIENLSGFLGGMQAAQGQIDAVGKRLESVGKASLVAGKNLGLLAAPFVAAAGLAIKASIDFETAMSGARKTLGLTREETKALGSEIIDLSLRIPVAATELGKIAEIAGQLGVGRNDIVVFTETIAKLGATTSLTTEDAATSIARFANITGLSLQNVGSLGSVIVELGNNFATTEPEILAMATRLAAVGDAVGTDARSNPGLFRRSVSRRPGR